MQVHPNNNGMQMQNMNYQGQPMMMNQGQPMMMMNQGQPMMMMNQGQPMMMMNQGQPMMMQNQGQPMMMMNQGQPMMVQQGQGMMMQKQGPPMQIVREGLDNYKDYPNLFVKQTRKGCLQECCGCDDTTEFRVATMENRTNNILYMIEQSSCCNRFFCGKSRPFTMKVHSGKDASGPLVNSFSRPLRCAAQPCKFCCQQELSVIDNHGMPIGMVKEECCWLCVPSFNVLDGSGSVQYRIAPPTCCGCCVDCCRLGCLKYPFMIYNGTGGMSKENEIGSITKIFSGLSKEFLTDADNFEIVFPKDADPYGKTRLLGGLALINQIFFEGQRGSATLA